VPFAKKRLAWTRAIFDAAVDIDGTPPDPNGLVVFDALTDIIGTGTDYQRKYNVRRCIIRLQYEIAMLSSAIGTQPLTIYSSLFVQDREDTDVTLLTTAQGDIFEGGASRILHTDVHSAQLYEIPTAVLSNTIVYGPRVEIDWKGNAKLGLDDLLTYGFQLVSAVNGVVSSMTVHAITSVLFEAT